ncbi:MAG: PRC and DUF2382 domain-containing protein [Pseudomonadota bacterium]
MNNSKDDAATRERIIGGSVSNSLGNTSNHSAKNFSSSPIDNSTNKPMNDINSSFNSENSMTPTTTIEDGQYIDYTVMDMEGEKIGKVETVWLDQDQDPAYLAVSTGWLGMGQTVVLPTQSAEVNQVRQQIRVPYTLEQTKNAPEFDSAVELQEHDEEQITSYYGSHGFRQEGWLKRQNLENLNDRERDFNLSQDLHQNPNLNQSNLSQSQTLQDNSKTSMTLKEEELKVGKREVEYGGVRLRKIVRTEVVNRPVELNREEIVIERVPSNDHGVVDADFKNEEIYIPLRREEAVISKEAHVREEVKLGKRQEHETQNISEKIRREDVEIDRNTSTSKTELTGDRNRSSINAREKSLID